VTPITSRSSRIYWNHSLGIWLIHIENEIKVSDELWLNHLLLTTDYPVFRVRTSLGYLHFSRYLLPNKSLASTREMTDLQIATCEKCLGLCISQHDGTAVCAHCTHAHYQLPEEKSLLAKCDDILTNPGNYKSDQKIASLSLGLMALAAINRLDEKTERDLILPHIGGRSERTKVGYQSLLILTGIDILKSSEPNERITIPLLTARFTKWVGESNRVAIAAVLPTCTNYWLSKGWIIKIEGGVYQRVQHIPLLDNG
jgi:hypothetical protein